ncbi:Protein plant cadmium resistance 12 [Vitis vinifera]|uniref:Protein plant cadmium resistance 12 n=1 Tax=Vitis vinifera TaxID=29760 RepID=A0A438ECY3_VITVI|nr:Protein plant cadmium resistance 12 [Vitis vinifera]
MYPNNSINAPTSKSAVPVPAPAPAPNQVPEGQWSTGLWDCSEDPSNCKCLIILIYFSKFSSPASAHASHWGGLRRLSIEDSMVSGLIYYALGAVGCGWLFAGTYRSKLRAMFSLPEAPCGDLLVHCCCCVCALCQEYRELKNRGADPSIGWQANVEKWDGAGIKVPPIAAPGMAR